MPDDQSNTVRIDKPVHTPAWRGGLLEQHGVTFVIAILIAIGALTTYFVNQAIRDARNVVAIEGLQILAESVTHFRNFYTETVVPRAREAGMVITQDYRNVPNALPLPATFTLDFGSFMAREDSSTRVVLFSDYPFPNRAQRQLDDFQQKAITHLRQEPTRPYTRIDTIDGRQVLRYARADRMQTACVACHNNIADSPRRDWSVGDTRGVLEVQRILDPGDTDVVAAYGDLLRPLSSLGIAGVTLMLLVLTTVVALRGSLRTNRALAGTQIQINGRLSKEVALRAQSEDRLRVNEERITKIFNSVLEGIVVIDEAGRICEVNDAALELFGYRREELRGCNVAILMPAAIGARHDGYLTAYLDTGRQQMLAAPRHVVAMHKSGGMLPVRIAVSETLSLGQRLFTAVIKDISAAEAAERALREAKEAAESASRLKSEFLTHMSHELRTPLNAILGHAQLMSEEFLRGSAGRGQQLMAREHASQIMRSGWHLLELINDVLDLSKIESGMTTLMLEAVELGPQMDACLAQIETGAAGRRIQIRPLQSLGTPGWVTADAVKLRQVLLNLLSNAVKYNVDGGEVEVTVAPGQAGRTRISVRDTGRGMTTEQIAQLFQPFVRFASRGEVSEGSGIGLALSRRLTEMMGGRLTVNSVSGYGSVFTLDLAQCEAPPETLVAPDMPPQTTASAMPDGPAVPLRVLYVEDSLTNYEVVRLYLKQQGGFELLHAPDGERGLEMAQQFQPDVILLDMNLPGIQGAEVQARLAQDERSAHIPVVALSAGALTEDIERALASGFSDYLTKPIRLSSLKDVLLRLRPSGT